MEKKLTNEELVKALGHCMSKECWRNADCPLHYEKDCIEIMSKNAIDLIQRQKAEIERLKNAYREGLEQGKFDSQVKITELQKQVYEWKLKSRELEESWEISSSNEEKLQKQVDELTEQLEYLNWYKMWHNKFKKEIEDLTLELETYRPTKLSGNGQCKCSNCGVISWTDWFSRYKGQTLCNNCLKKCYGVEVK